MTDAVISLLILAGTVGLFLTKRLPLVAGTILIVLFFGTRLLPSRLSSTLPPDLSRHAQTLIEHYSLDNVFHFRVNEGSPLLGSPRD